MFSRILNLSLLAIFILILLLGTFQLVLTNYRDLVPEMFQAEVLRLERLLNYRTPPAATAPAGGAAAAAVSGGDNSGAEQSVPENGTASSPASPSSSQETIPGSTGFQGTVPAPVYLARGPEDDPVINDPVIYVARIIANILFLSGIAAVVMVILAGIQYIMAYGKDENIQKAKGTLTWALVGLLVVILAYFIVENIISYLYTRLQ
jgi:hypothetical protein